MAYEAFIVNNAGVRLADISQNIVIKNLSWALNKPGSASFNMHTFDANTLQAQVLREIQFWRDGVLLWWGVIVRVRSSNQIIEFECQGLLWYFYRRFFGKANRTNYLANPGFEADLASWSATGTTATADGVKTKTGTKSAKLVQAVTDADRYLGQNVNLVAGGVGEFVTLVGWYYVESIAGVAFEERGLGMIVGTNFDFFTIPSNAPVERWQRAEIGINIPPNASVTINARAYSPNGTIRWDAMSMTLMESLSRYDTDMTAIVAAIVQHLQDTSFNKSNLNISTNTPASGVILTRHYQFAEHGNGGRALEEFSSMTPGCDYEIVVTGTTRVFTTYSPSKGSAKNTFAINQNQMIDYEFSQDGELAISSLTILADGDGPDREEGSAIDQGIFTGLILEEVEAAPAGTEIDALDKIALSELSNRKKPEIISCSVPHQTVALLGNVFVGDNIPVTIDFGYVQALGNYRVISMSFDPKKELMSLEFNKL